MFKINFYLYSVPWGIDIVGALVINLTSKVIDRFSEKKEQVELFEEILAIYGEEVFPTANTGDYECVGVHVININGRNHPAFTIFDSKHWRWKRYYDIRFDSSDSVHIHSPLGFAFNFNIENVEFSTYCAHTHYMDDLVKSICFSDETN